MIISYFKSNVVKESCEMAAFLNYLKNDTTISSKLKSELQATFEKINPHQMNLNYIFIGDNCHLIAISNQKDRNYL